MTLYRLHIASFTYAHILKRHCTICTSFLSPTILFSYWGCGQRLSYSYINPYHIILVHIPQSHHTQITRSYTYPYHIIHIPQSHHTQVHTLITSYIPQSQHTQIIPTHTPITSHSSTYMYPNHIILKYISLSHHTQVHTPITSNHITLKYIPQSQHTQITHTKSR